VKERSGVSRLEITDNGPGIPDEFKSAVFRPVKENMKNPKGMGLYLVKRSPTGTAAGCGSRTGCTGTTGKAPAWS